MSSKTSNKTSKKSSKAPEKSQEILIEDLLDPISGKDTCGENVRYTEIYDNIREARREEDSSLSQGVWQTDVKRAEWDMVVHLCVDTLISKSKDLQVAAWLTEAWLHMEGMAGFVKGIQLIHGLTNEYWDGLYPKIEADNSFELRVSPFEWMNNKLSEEILQILITLPSDPAALPYCYTDWQDSSRIERMKKSQPVAGGSGSPQDKVTFAQVTAGIEQTPTAFYAHMDQSCLEAAKALNALEDDLREHIGTEMPSFFKIREKIDLVSHFARAVLDDRGEAQKKARESKEESLAGKMQVNPGRIGKLQSREQAYAQLEAIAAFLTKIEPHSPTPYLIRRAITWGGMSLNEVVQDLMGQGQDTKTLLYLLDIASNEGEDH